MSEQKPGEQPEQPPRPNAIDTYFRNLIVLNQALTTEGQPFRDSHAQPRTDTARERATLWLGCNVLRTPHIAQLAVSIVRMLNPELSILGGPSHCCGSPMPERGDRERALARTIGHFRAEAAPTLISWCPSCHTNLRKGSDASSWGFDELHVTEFIARRLDRLELKIPVSARVMLHGHTGTPDRDRDMENCRKLLTAIPGVTIVAEHSEPDLGLHCVPILLAPRIGIEGFERRIQELLRMAREAGAEMLVTIYHSCYREIEKRLHADAPVIENYITLLAKALELPVPANIYRELAHGAGARIEELRCAAQERGVNGREFDRALKAEFPPAPAPDKR